MLGNRKLIAVTFTLGTLAGTQHSLQLLFKALLQACSPEMYSLLKFSLVSQCSSWSVLF